MVLKALNKRFLFTLAISLISLSIFAEVDTKAGKALFKANCASCHNKNMKDDLTGPALGLVRERWEGREDVLYAWIRNSQGVIATGDKYAVDLYNKWNKSNMTAFPTLTDGDIDNLLAYVDGMYDGSLIPQGPTPPPGATTAEAGGNNNMLYGVLALILGLLALVLTRIIANLKYLNQVKEGVAAAKPASLLELLTSKGIVGFLLFGLVLFGGYTTVNNAIDLGRQQGYEPDQPIKFSHVTHAGVHKIDCQYCHDGARRSKHSVIPAANTCMNCHKAIEKGSQYGTAEITKIFASIGYDPSTDTYIEDYENMHQDSIQKVYTKWIADNYMKDKKLEKLNDEGKRVVDEQWKNLVSSLTNKQKTKIQGPIEWTRVHNLPDHVYFNHAQHVTVGKVDCANCHGPVEKMEVVQQYAPLSMGWCVNCHRETEVQFGDNEYYNSYENYHAEIKAGTREKVTVEEIGGLECQKCHY